MTCRSLAMGTGWTAGLRVERRHVEEDASLTRRASMMGSVLDSLTDMSDDWLYPGETDHFTMSENTRTQGWNHKHTVITPASIDLLCPHCSTLLPQSLLQQPLY